MGRAECIENFDQLFTCRAIFPVAFAPDDFQQGIDGLFIASGRVKAECQIKLRLQILGVGIGFGLQLCQIAAVTGFLCELHGGNGLSNCALHLLRFGKAADDVFDGFNFTGGEGGANHAGEGPLVLRAGLLRLTI